MKTLVVALLFPLCAVMAQEPEETPAPRPTVIQVEGSSVSVAPVHVELLNVVLASINRPSELKVVISKLTPPEIVAVIVSLASRPNDLRVVLEQLSSSQLAAVFHGLAVRPVGMQPTPLSVSDVPTVNDVIRWVPVLAWLGAKSSNSRNWIAVSKLQISDAIQKSGYTPEILSRAEGYMKKESNP